MWAGLDQFSVFGIKNNLEVLCSSKFDGLWFLLLWTRILSLKMWATDQDRLWSWEPERNEASQTPPQTAGTPNIAVGEMGSENIISGKVLLKYFRVGENTNTHWYGNMNPVFRLIHRREKRVGQTYENSLWWKEKIRLVTSVDVLNFLGGRVRCVEALVEDRGFSVLTLLKNCKRLPNATPCLLTHSHNLSSQVLTTVFWGKMITRVL